MSLHVYVAYPGFKDEPISVDAWISAAIDVSEKDDNVIFERTERYAIVYLKNNKRQSLNLDPYGLIHAQDPNMEMIEIMFRIAEILNAKVYSEKLKPYLSPNEWEQRTKTYRKKREKEQMARINQGRSNRLFWILLLAIAGSIGWYLGR